MQEVYVQMGECIYPIRMNPSTTTFFELYHEILNIFCGYEMDELVNHFQLTYPDINETFATRGISAGHIFVIPMKINAIYK